MNTKMYVLKTMPAIIFSLAFIMFVATAQAQEESPLSRWYSEAGFGMGTPSFNNTDTCLTTWDMNVSFGYELSPKFTLKVPVALSWNLLKNTVATPRTDTYSTSYRVDGLAGLAAGYSIGNNRRWQLTAEAGHSMGGKSDGWKCFYYDLGGKYYLDKPGSRVGFVGLSVRQYISEIKGTPNYFMLHATIGSKVNWKR
jgi:hypothetical protein